MLKDRNMSVLPSKIGTSNGGVRTQAANRMLRHGFAFRPPCLRPPSSLDWKERQCSGGQIVINRQPIGHTGDPASYQLVSSKERGTSRSLLCMHGLHLHSLGCGYWPMRLPWAKEY